MPGINEKKANEILDKIKDEMPNNTFEYLHAKTQLSYYAIRRYCKQNNIELKRKKRNKSLHHMTTKKLKKLSKIDTTKKTQKQLAKILGGKKPLSRQGCCIFLKKHKIEYKKSDKDTITEQRLKKINGLSETEKKQMDVLDYADLLGFEGYYAIQYATRFLNQHKIEYNK